MQSFIQNGKIETKNALFGFFLGWNLKKSVVVFDTTTLEFYNMLSFVQNKKTSNLE